MQPKVHIATQEKRFVLHVVLRLHHIGQWEATDRPSRVLECLFGGLSGPHRLVFSQSLAKSGKALVGGHVVATWAVDKSSISRSSRSSCWSWTRGQCSFSAGPDLYGVSERQNHRAGHGGAWYTCMYRSAQPRDIKAMASTWQPIPRPCD